MKTKATLWNVAYVSFFASAVFVSCKKNDISATGTAGEASTSATIAVAASASTAFTDSVYLLQPCERGSRRDTISESNLPATVSAYISSNYSGSVFHRAFALKNSSGTVTGYVAVIYFNDKPVGLQFDSDGNFQKVLEQRERGDLEGGGWHHGGRFHHRDGLQKDTVALANLPVSIQTYLTANYGADTVIKAFTNPDSSYVVLSKNNGLYANIFDASGSFVERSELPSRHGLSQNVEAAVLPATITAYLGSAYPNYVFKKAFSSMQNGALAGYTVLIDANNTKYAVQFDASGNFIRASTVC